MHIRNSGVRMFRSANGSDVRLSLSTFTSRYDNLRTMSGGSSSEAPTSTEDDRAQRLVRMRESQRKLRSQRRNELNELKKINEELKRQNELLIKKNESLMKDFDFVADLFTEEISSRQLEKLVTEADKDFTSCYGEDDIITMEEFITKANFTNVQVLYVDEHKFILEEVCEKTLACMSKAFKFHASIPLKSTPFRYLRKYGLDVVRIHLDTIKMLSRGKVPKCWLEENHSLPNGAMPMVDVLRHITQLPSKTFEDFNIFVLCSFMARNCFATNSGLGMFKQDVLASIEAAMTPHYDSEFLMGTLDVNLCPPNANVVTPATSFSP